MALNISFCGAAFLGAISLASTVRNFFPSVMLDRRLSLAPLFPAAIIMGLRGLGGGGGGAERKSSSWLMSKILALEGGGSFGGTALEDGGPPPGGGEESA